MSAPLAAALLAAGLLALGYGVWRFGRWWDAREQRKHQRILEGLGLVKRLVAHKGDPRLQSWNDRSRL